MIKYIKSVDTTRPVHYEQDYDAQHVDIYSKMYASPDDIKHVRAREEYYLIHKQYEADKSISVRWFELLRNAPNRKRTFIASLLMWGDQFLGIFVITNYGVLIYSR